MMHRQWLALGVLCLLTAGCDHSESEITSEGPSSDGAVNPDVGSEADASPPQDMATQDMALIFFSGYGHSGP